MITISVCMIVKDEEKNLAACLDGLTQIADEIIIVDTGSTDATKNIASQYTDKIYDFAWTGSFSDARNFAFSKAGMEYIYSADADERLDEENIERFLTLKQTLLSEIEIVQMYYCNQLENNTIYSFDKEYRPKLYKRIRTFTWQEKIHEAVNLEPIVYDSDIEIIHKPHGDHGKRDLQIFADMILNEEPLSKRLIELYGKEVFIVGGQDDLNVAGPFFAELTETAICGEDQDMLKRACCIAARYYRMKNDVSSFFKYALRVTACESCSEMCYEIGMFYMDKQDFQEAGMWFYNAAFETQPLLSISYQERMSLEKLAECCRQNGDEESAAIYLQKIK